MTKTTTNLLGIIITILAGAYFYIAYCSSCCASVKEEPVEKEVVAPVAAKPTSYPFAFSDGDFTYNVNDNFNFNMSSFDYLEPLSQKVRDGIVPGLKNFLAENTYRVINITAYYTSDETNNSAFPNLGSARANTVKNYFVSQNIPSSQMNTMGKLMSDMVPKKNIYMGPVAYRVAEVAANAEDEIKSLYEKIEADPLVLYFDTAEASINPSVEQRQKFADIVRYLDKVPKAKSEIVGYADSQGKRSTNRGLGKKERILRRLT